MLKYYVSLMSSVLAIVLVAMLITRGIEVFVSREDAIDFGYIVGPVALICIGLVVVLFDSWRCRLVTAAMSEQLGVRFS